MKAYKGRRLRPGQKTKAYFNLHRLEWSLVADEGPFKGLVCAHVAEASLGGVTFKISESGRQRAIREGKKNVHAYAVGILLDTPVAPGDRLSYNPFKAGHFTRAGEPVTEAAAVLLGSDGKAYAGLE